MRGPWIDVDSLFVDMDAWSRQFGALLATRPAERAFDGAFGLVEGKDGVTRWVADLPGVRKEDLDVKFENGALVLDVKRGTAPPEGWQARRSERSPFELRRTVRLPEDIDVDAVTASFEHGVLTVALPRRARTTRTIDIRHS